MLPTKRIALTISMMVLLTGALFAQSPVTLKGKLLNGAQKEPLSYASVALYSKGDSALVRGVISKENGKFLIDNVERASYYLKVSFMGYMEKVIQLVDLEKAKSVYDLGKIILKQTSHALEDVQIKRERLKGKTEIDKTVYNLNDDIRAVASSGLDVLKQMPAVDVDMFGNVSLEGSSSIRFTVNGIIRDKDYVAQLNPQQIDKVEVITNPSVKYDAAISGVINIVLKEKVNYGVQGQVQGDLPSPDAVLINPRVNLEYGRENLRVYAYNRLHYEDFTGKLEETSKQFHEGYTLKQERNGKGPTNYIRNNMNAGVDWFLNKQNTLNLNVNYRYSERSQNDYQMDQRVYLNDELSRMSDLEQDNEEDSRGTYYSMYWKHDFPEKGHRLLLETGFYDGVTDQLQNFSYTYRNVNSGDVTNTVNRRQFISSNNSNIPLKIDYERKFDNLKLETGYKGLYEWYNNDMKKGRDEVLASSFQYNEMRHAGYANLSFRHKRWQFQSGLRAEYSGIKMNEGEATTEYFCLLPQFSIFRKLENSQSLKLSYRRRIFRPQITNINPFEQQMDSMHVRVGNPDLDPSYSNKLELAYSKNFKSNYVKPALYARYITNGMHDISYINAAGITETTVDNIGKTYEYGLSLTGALQPAKWMKLNVHGSLYYKHIASESSLSVTAEPQQKLSYRVNARTIINPYKDYNLFFRVRYEAPQIEYQRTLYRDLMLLGGLQKNILENLKVAAYAIIPTTNEFTYRRYMTETPNLEREWKGSVAFDFVGILKLTWSFDYGNKVKKLKRSQENEDKGSGGLM